MGLCQMKRRETIREITGLDEATILGEIELHGIAMHTVQMIRTARAVGLLLLLLHSSSYSHHYDHFLTLAAS